MAEEVGGIMAEVGADASTLRSTLQQSETLLRQFHQRWGRINLQVQVTMPAAAALRSQVQALVNQIGPVRVPVELAAPRGGVAATPTGPIQRPAQPVAVAAQAAPDPRIAAQARANATGRAVQFSTAEGTLGRVFPVGGGGPVGGRGGESIGGVPLPPGARGFAGAAGPGGENLQRIIEDNARLRSEVDHLRTEVSTGLSEAQIAQRRAAGQAGAAAVARDPNTGRFVSPAAIPSREQQLDEQVRRMEQQQRQRITRPPQPATIAAQALPAPIQTVADIGSERNLAALMGEFGPAEQERAIASLPSVGRLGRRGTTAQPRTARPPRLSAREQGQVLEQAGSQVPIELEAPEGGVGQEEALRQRLIQSRFATTVRAPGTFLAGVLGSTGTAAAREAQEEAGRAQREATTLKQQAIGALSQQVQLERRISEEGRKPELVRALSNQRQEVERLATSYQAAAEYASEATVEAERLAGTGLRGLAAGFAGGVIGSLAFGVGMAAVSSAIEAGSAAAKNGINSLTGYRETTNQLAADLAQQVRQHHGHAEAVVAEAFAYSGLGPRIANTIRPLLEERAALQAGSQAFGEQIDQIQAFINLREQLRQRGPIPGVTTGIGGVLGTQLFAQPGIVEQLSQLTPGGISRERATAGAVTGAAGGALAGAGAGFLVGGPLGALAGALIGGLGGAGIGGFAAGQTAPGGGVQAGFGVPQNPRLAQQFFAEQRAQQGQTEEAATATEVLALAVSDLNEAVARGRPEFAGMRAEVGRTGDDVKRTAELLRALQVPEDQVANLERAGFAFRDIARFDPSQAVARVSDFLRAGGRGATIPSSQEFLRNLREQEIPARQFQLRMNAELQRALNVAQAGIARAAQPPLPLGTTIPGGVGAISPALQSLLGPGGLGARGPIAALDNLQADRVEIAQATIRDLTAPLGGGAQQQAAASFNRLQGLGQQASGLQSFITAQQVGLATAQFDEQIRQASLQAGDLAAILATVQGRSEGIAGAAGSTLGVYQGQLILLQRESQELQLHTQELGIQAQLLQQDLAQRQINFRLASAGFVAPGTTPAERAARIAEAKLEADFAQRQLNIQKEITSDQQRQTQITRQTVPLQIAVQDITLQRDYITASRALDLLVRGRQVTIDVAGATEALNRVNQEIALEQQNLQTLLQAGAEMASSLIADAAKFIAMHKQSSQDLADAAGEFFNGLNTSYSRAISSYLRTVFNRTQEYANRLNGRPSSGSGGTGGAHTGVVAAQSGFLGGVSRPTQFLAGEVGHETVAILRNPRELTGLDGGGQSVTVQINFNGATVRDDSDIRKIAIEVQRLVEEGLGRRISAFGFSAAR